MIRASDKGNLTISDDFLGLLNDDTKVTFSKPKTQSMEEKKVNEFADKFLVNRGGHLEFKAKYGEFEKWLSKSISQAKREERERFRKTLYNAANEIDEVESKVKYGERDWLEPTSTAYLNKIMSVAQIKGDKDE